MFTVIYLLKVERVYEKYCRAPGRWGLHSPVAEEVSVIFFSALIFCFDL